MKFERDSQEAARNQLKHAVSFQEAASVLRDAFSVMYHDPDHSIAEHRFITVGMFKRAARRSAVEPQSSAFA